MRIFIDNNKIERGDLNTKDAIRISRQGTQADCELGYPEEWLDGNVVWVDSTHALDLLAQNWGDALEHDNFYNAQAYLNDIRHIVDSIAAFMQNQETGA